MIALGRFDTTEAYKGTFWSTFILIIPLELPTMLQASASTTRTIECNGFTPTIIQGVLTNTDYHGPLDEPLIELNLSDHPEIIAAGDKAFCQCDCLKSIHIPIATSMGNSVFAY